MLQKCTQLEGTKSVSKNFEKQSSIVGKTIVEIWQQLSLDYPEIKKVPRHNAGNPWRHK